MIKPKFFLPFESLRKTRPIHCTNVFGFLSSTLSRKIQQSKFLMSEPSRCLQAQNNIPFCSSLENSLKETKL